MIENFENKNIQSFEYEKTINSDGNIIGTCELGNATVQLLNDSNEYSDLKGQWIKTIHGSFYIHSVEPVQEKVNIKLSCYDIKYKLDTSYDNTLYAFPMTLKEWRNQIGTNCGIMFDDADFPNSELMLEKEPYIGNNPSNRKVISIIAQAGCSWVDTDKEDIFYFKWFNDKIHLINDWLELTTEKELTKPINVVVLGRGDVNDNIMYPEILPDDPNEFRIDNNYILDPQDDTEDQRYETIIPIYERVNGFSYLLFNLRTQDVENKLSIKLGERIVYTDIWGNILSSYVMSKKITYLGGDLTNDNNYEIILSAEEINETSTEYSYAESIDDRVIKVERTTDKQNGEIRDLVSSTEVISTNLNNNYTANEELNQKLEEQKSIITKEMTTMVTQNKSEWQTSVIEYINANGIEKFVNMLVTIDIEGLKLSKSDEDIVSLLNNKGLYVSDGKLRDDLLNLLMKVDRSGAMFKLLEVIGTIKEHDIIQKEKITHSKYGVCQAWYWVGDING